MIGIWQDFLQSASVWGTSAIIIRLLVALIIGSIIGLDRGLKRRSAGMKTHSLVCMASALVMITSQYMQVEFDSNADLSRMGAQVISGVGFLGVGTIIVTGKNQIKGLTTAAGLWACACIGLAIGIGFVEGAIITLLFILLSFSVLSRLGSFLQRHTKVFNFYIEFQNNRSVSHFLKAMSEKELVVTSLDISKGRMKGEGPNAIVCVESKKRMDTIKFATDIRDMEFIKYAEEL